jgi:hypothetical protein
MSRETLTPKQVAQAIGASEASLKRWCDRASSPPREPWEGIGAFL